MSGIVGPQIHAASFIIEIIQQWGLPAVMAGLLGTGGLGALVPAIIAWRKAPIERKDAELSAAETSQGMSLQLAQELRAELQRMGERITTLEEKLEREAELRQNLQAEIRQERDVNYRLRVVIARVQDAVDYLTAHWSVVRLKEDPPHFPILSVEDQERGDGRAH